MQPQYPPQPHRKLAILIIVLLVIVGFAFFVYRNTHQHTIRLSGINAINAPSDRKDAISKTLYNVLQSNLPKKNFTINDAVIRTGSYIDNYDSLTNVHHASFIVDIQSIKQSYIAYYEWSSNNQNPNLSGYPVVVGCLPPSLLKYGEFKCTPVQTSTSNNRIDIINRYLPYHVETKYKIVDATTNSQTTQLNVQAYMPATMVAMTPALLQQYSNEINAWITSKGLDPHNYSISYQY